MGEQDFLRYLLESTKLTSIEKECIMAQAELIYQLGIKEGLEKGYQIIKELTK